MSLRIVSQNGDFIFLREGYVWKIEKLSRLKKGAAEAIDTIEYSTHVCNVWRICTCAVYLRD